MRRLLYLVPVVLLALCALAMPVYKDRVGYSASGVGLSLSPSHWKLLSYSVSAQGVLSAAHSSGKSAKPDTVSHGAKIWGFPAGAFLINHTNSSDSYYASSSAVSAFSWLWGGVDIVFIAGSLAFAIIYNRRHGGKKTYPSLYDELQQSLAKTRTTDEPTVTASEAPIATQFPQQSITTVANTAPIPPMERRQAPVMDVQRRPMSPSYTARPTSNSTPISVSDQSQA